MGLHFTLLNHLQIKTKKCLKMTKHKHTVISISSGAASASGVASTSVVASAPGVASVLGVALVLATPDVLPFLLAGGILSDWFSENLTSGCILHYNQIKAF